MKMRNIFLALAVALSVSGCDDADVASRNISKAADNFEITRRIVFYNGITGDYMLSLEGRCSFNADNSRKLDVTCKTGPNEYKKHSLGLSDNVTYFSEQLAGADVPSMLTTLASSMLLAKLARTNTRNIRLDCLTT